MVLCFRAKKSPRLARCGRGCRRPDVDEMIHAYPERLDSARKRRRAA